MRTMFSTGLLLLVLAGVSSGAPVPDFTLSDSNANSPRRNSAVSPRDYLLQVSAYYFGAAD
jgi:hypothetical protein